jgi:hypothetical protein
MNAAVTAKTIKLLIDSAERGARVRFTPLDRIPDTMGREFPEERTKALLAALQADLNIDEGNHELSLSIGAAPIER